MRSIPGLVALGLTATATAPSSHAPDATIETKIDTTIEQMPATLEAEIERRYRTKRYHAPVKAGMSYMVAPVFRTIGPPDLKVRTMAMPHLMSYAPYTSNADIGAAPDLANPATLHHPFIDRQGNDEQSYIIQLVGEAEKARILSDEKALVDALCAYRELLCLGDGR
jgi:hypothetical protein